MTQRRYEWSSEGMDRDRKNDSGLLDMDDEMTKNVVYGAVGLAAGATLMHFAMKHNWLGLGARPASQPAQVAATSTASQPAASQPAASQPVAGSQGVRLGVFT